MENCSYQILLQNHSQFFPFRRSSPDGQSFRSSVEEKPLKNRIMSNHDEDSDDNDYENVSKPHQVARQFLSKSCIALS